MVNGVSGWVAPLPGVCVAGVSGCVARYTPTDPPMPSTSSARITSVAIRCCLAVRPMRYSPLKTLRSGHFSTRQNRDCFGRGGGSYGEIGAGAEVATTTGANSAGANGGDGGDGGGERTSLMAASLW